MTECTEPLFPPRVVSRALDIPAGTLATWARRGWMRNFDAAHTEGRGHARMFTLPDALALALFKFASDNGIIRADIITTATHTAKGFINSHDQVTQLIVRYYRDSVSIRYNDDVMSEPAEPDPQLTIIVDLRSIFGEAIRALVLLRQKLVSSG